MSGGRRNPYAGSDTRTRQARGQGFPARSVFKLSEIDDRFRLLSTGQRVVDLGASPGSWSMYVSQRIGSTGHLLSIDLKPLEVVLPSFVQVVQGDAFDVESDVHSQAGPYDVILSDMAPNTGGDKAQNAMRSFGLFESAVHVASVHGRAGAHFVGKLFMGRDFERAKSLVGSQFESCKVVKPRGTRSNSVEVFLVGLSKRG